VIQKIFIEKSLEHGFNFLDDCDVFHACDHLDFACCFAYQMLESRTWYQAWIGLHNCTRTVIWLPIANLTCGSSIFLQKLSQHLSTQTNNTKFHCAFWKRNFSIRFCFQSLAGLTQVWRRKSLSLLLMKMSHFWVQTWQKCRKCTAPNSWGA